MTHLSRAFSDTVLLYAWNCWAASAGAQLEGTRMLLQASPIFVRNGKSMQPPPISSQSVGQNFRRSPLSLWQLHTSLHPSNSWSRRRQRWCHARFVGSRNLGLLRSKSAVVSQPVTLKSISKGSTSYELRALVISQNRLPNISGQQPPPPPPWPDRSLMLATHQQSFRQAGDFTPKTCS